MERLNLGEIAVKLTGKSENWQNDIFTDDICTDTRALSEGCLFVALEGERFDGHDYIEAALEKGAVAAVAHKRSDYKSDRIIYVNDTQRALMDIGGLYRDKFSPKVAAVTGSVGKTTTKEMIWCVLSSQYNTLKTEGNLNNEIGLPKTLLRLNPSVDAAVIEMGMTHMGEITLLTQITKPDVAVITNIGVSHIENLGSRENILKAKLEVTDGLKKGSPLILNVDNDLLSTVSSDEFEIVGYAVHNENADIRAVDIKESVSDTEFSILFNGKKYEAYIPCVGEHNVLDALAGFAVGVAFGIEPQKAASALARYAPSGMRQKIVEKDGFTIVEDCYNASPDSMFAALRTLGKMNCKGKRIAVLADMLELGDYSEKAHSSVGEAAANEKIDLVLAFGNDGKYIAEAAQKDGTAAEFYSDKELLTKRALSECKDGNILWFKGSRGMKLEEVIHKIYGENEE